MATSHTPSVLSRLALNSSLSSRENVKATAGQLCPLSGGCSLSVAASTIRRLLSCKPTARRVRSWATAAERIHDS